MARMQDHLVPRIFPEIWSRILFRSCPTLASLSRSTAINREVRAICFSTARSKIDFLLARCHGNLNGALRMLDKAHGMPDFVDCLESLMREGAVYECRRSCRRRHSWTGCLLRGLMGRKDAIAAVTACLGDKMSMGIRFSDSHIAKGVRQAFDAGDVAMMAILVASSTRSARRAAGVGWDRVVTASADVARARELLQLLGMLPTVMGLDTRNAILACCRKGGEFYDLAAELVPAGDGDRRLMARFVWGIMDWTDDELVRRVIEMGLRPSNVDLWGHLESLQSLPSRASDDAFLLLLLRNGEFEPTLRISTGRGHGINAEKLVTRLDLMRDLADARVIKADHLDNEIIHLIDRPFDYTTAWERKLELIDGFRAGGGNVLNITISAALRKSAPDAFVTALIDRMPDDGPKDPDVIPQVMNWSHAPFMTASILLSRSFPVSLSALDAAVQWTRARWGWDEAMRAQDAVDPRVVGLVAELLAHADVAALVEQDRAGREAGDNRVIVKAMQSPNRVDEVPRILEVVKLLVNAGFEVKEDDATLASLRGWVHTRALLQSRCIG